MNPRTPQLLLLALGLLLAASGCVERGLVITSDPPGATVMVNNRFKGTTPFALPFRDYGVFSIELEHPDCYPLRVAEPVKAPAYDVAGVDFFSNVLYPGKISDLRELHYRLESRGDSVDQLEDVADRAAAMRAERNARIADRESRDAEDRLAMPTLPLREKNPDATRDSVARRRTAAQKRAAANATAPVIETIDAVPAAYIPPVPSDVPLDIAALDYPVASGVVRYGAVALAPSPDFTPGVGLGVAPIGPVGPTALPPAPEAIPYVPAVPSEVPMDMVTAAEITVRPRYEAVPSTWGLPAEWETAPALTPTPEADTRVGPAAIVYTPPVPTLDAVIDAPAIGTPLPATRYEPVSIPADAPVVAPPLPAARMEPLPIVPFIDFSPADRTTGAVDANPPAASMLESDADWIEATVLR